jgi:hypothetical protein
MTSSNDIIELVIFIYVRIEYMIYFAEVFNLFDHFSEMKSQ